jgi:hypothetical protein
MINRIDRSYCAFINARQPAAEKKTRHQLAIKTMQFRGYF